MKKKSIILAMIVAGIISFPFGAYIGVSYFSKGDVRPLINLLALKESFELNKLANLYEAQNEGYTEKVMDMLYVDIKTTFKLKGGYDASFLDSDSIESMKKYRKRAQSLLGQYPNTKFDNCE
jgi:hypothetical protein